MNYSERFEQAGLVKISAVCPDILVDLRYAGSDNFVGKVLYPSNDLDYCVPELAGRLADIQQELATLKPGHRLLVWDAARPLSVQRAMFATVCGTRNERYVANPDKRPVGGFHNYGMAVDLTIAAPDGKPIDMGTGFDTFDEAAHVGGELDLFYRGMLSPQAYANRMFLYYITSKHGLMPYKWEWWHYQLHLSEDDKSKYQLLDF